ncbi:hypothetical protein QAD02_004439 [Eretmocerus hayati]|uniref:Uncharacterized protein n=1 Tax=Eretmocerus hayati TaxID=131215 RepID=A0ACC2NPY5_9HYME|nr:hypothetical protein QAD02_004439 [Eretmocerus hayati]
MKIIITVIEFFVVCNSINAAIHYIPVDTTTTTAHPTTTADARPTTSPTTTSTFRSQLEFSTKNSESTVKTETNGCEVDLDFSDLGLGKIRPNSISGLNIKSLTVRGNSIRNFETNTFNSLPNLEHLDISNNMISKENLFSFGPMPSLKSLILDKNFDLESLNYDSRHSDSCPDDEYFDRDQGCTTRYSALEMNVDFPEVTHLSLRNIFMTSISNYWSSKFPKLMVLDVSNNRLTPSDDFFEKLPSTVKNLTMENVQFTSLKIRSSNNIILLNLNLNNFETLSSSRYDENTLLLRNMDELKSLLVAGCLIKTIETDAFKNLQKLTHLDISNNSLSEVPHGVFGYLHSLSYLDISENPLVEMPDISTLKELKTLKMNKMGKAFLLTGIEGMQPMPSIQSISLQDNDISYIPNHFFDKFQGLQEIDLSNNRLTSLPSGSWQMNFRKINLCHNQITNIEDLQLDQASSLEVLNLENNNITGIKLAAVQRLPSTVFLKV